MPSRQCRNYCFTSFNIDQEPQYDQAHILYLAYGRESCPTSNREHWQGFVVFARKRTLASAKTWLPGAHFECMEGNLEQNERYCSKEGNYKTFGRKPAPGTRTDLAGAVGDILAGTATSESILRDSPVTYSRAHVTLERAQAIFNRNIKREWMTEIVWIYGPTGTGKSHKVNELAPNAYVKPMGVKDIDWWDDYDGQSEVWFDDFRGQIAYDEMLRLADKWPKTVSRRCKAPAPFLAKTIYITSAVTPEEIYCKQAANDSRDSINQLKRRIREQIQLIFRYVPPTNNNVIDLSQEE